MALLSIHNLSIAFGGPPLLDSISFEIHKGQRICLLGRNGTGKSTLMKIIAGSLSADSGDIITEPGVRIGILQQEVTTAEDRAVFEIVAEGLGKEGTLFARLYHAERTAAPDDTIGKLRHEVTEHDCWHIKAEVDRILSQTGLDGTQLYPTLSGGMKRRVYLARALVVQPDLLLLDEPTNHLDISSIAWLESFIANSSLTLLFVTHDRLLLQRVASRIIELDRGAIFDWACNYPTFLERKQAMLASQEREWEKFDKKLAQEETWIRQGIQARRTRNEGRVRALLRLREERSRRRERSGNVQMEISEASRSGNRVINVRNLTFSYSDAPLVTRFSIDIVRRDRIGIIGPNGCGKTTLIKLILGELTPHEGSVSVGTNVQPLFFDQLRSLLDPEKTVWENIVPGGGDTVFINGASKHVMSYLQDFLFTAERARSPVKQLSGGERNRLLLARLFAVESNFLVLDEPTNDLDTETLELLEELLTQFTGTVLIVSHDRTFLNNTVGSIIAYEGPGTFKEYVGGYDDWERYTKATREKPPEPRRQPKKEPAPKKAVPKKRTYREEEEFAALPARIESLEAELALLTERMADPAWVTDADFLREASPKLALLEDDITAAYERWDYLENKGG